MTTKKQKFSGSEKRRYIRLKSVFPVEFQLLDSKTNKAITDWKQGFTNNISKGGICLSVNNLEDDISQHITKQDTTLSLNINIPLNKKPIKAVAKIAWLTKVKDAPLNQYLIGLTYTDIERNNLIRIMRYAKWMRFINRTSIYIIALLVLIIGGVSLYNFNLRNENRYLVNRLIDILQEDSSVKDQLEIIENDKERLEKVISESKEKIFLLELKLSEAQDNLEQALKSKTVNEVMMEEKTGIIKQLEEQISKIGLEQERLEQELSSVIIKEDTFTKELSRIEQTKTTLEEAMVEKMYHWLKVHQNSRTGLVLSFEGDVALNQWAFTYDQALVAQAYTMFGDMEKAQRIFSFFNRRIKQSSKFNGFVNAYYANSGDVAEYIIHSGPNIWLGIAVLQYTKTTNDSRYLPLAIRIADWLISIQNQDRQGGIRGGPDIRWFATEHNLDAFAFFNMLYKITNDAKYELAAKKVLSWLDTHAYDRPEVPVKRGKGDATIATDTYAWSIAAIGPRRLKSLGMNSDEILEFAIENCEVTVNYQRPDGKLVRVTGFDFAKYRNLPRGGIVSSEWTAQMIVSFKIMGEFHKQQKDYDKAKEYHKKAGDYLDELGKLIISSASPTGQGEGCLPYATAENVDTGHGWRTPFGNKTGSIAGTAYAIFAYRGYNPLD